MSKRNNFDLHKENTSHSKEDGNSADVIKTSHKYEDKSKTNEPKTMNKLETVNMLTSIKSKSSDMTTQAPTIPEGDENEKTKKGKHKKNIEVEAECREETGKPKRCDKAKTESKVIEGEKGEKTEAKKRKHKSIEGLKSKLKRKKAEASNEEQEPEFPERGINNVNQDMESAKEMKHKEEKKKKTKKGKNEGPEKEENTNIKKRKHKHELVKEAEVESRKKTIKIEYDRNSEQELSLTKGEEKVKEKSKKRKTVSANGLNKNAVKKIKVTIDDDSEPELPEVQESVQGKTGKQRTVPTSELKLSSKKIKVVIDDDSEPELPEVEEGSREKTKKQKTVPPSGLKSTNIAISNSTASESEPELPKVEKGIKVKIKKRKAALTNGLKDTTKQISASIKDRPVPDLPRVEANVKEHPKKKKSVSPSLVKQLVKIDDLTDSESEPELPKVEENITEKVKKQKAVPSSGLKDINKVISDSTANKAMPELLKVEKRVKAKATEQKAILANELKDRPVPDLSRVEDNVKENCKKPKTVSTSLVKQLVKIDDSTDSESEPELPKVEENIKEKAKKQKAVPPSGLKDTNKSINDSTTNKVVPELLKVEKLVKAKAKATKQKTIRTDESKDRPVPDLPRVEDIVKKESKTPKTVSPSLLKNLIKTINDSTDDESDSESTTEESVKTNTKKAIQAPAQVAPPTIKKPDVLVVNDTQEKVSMEKLPKLKKIKDVRKKIIAEESSKKKEEIEKSQKKNDVEKSNSTVEEPITVAKEVSSTEKKTKKDKQKPTDEKKEKGMRVKPELNNQSENRVALLENGDGVQPETTKGSDSQVVAANPLIKGNTIEESKPLALQDQATNMQIVPRTEDGVVAQRGSVKFNRPVIPTDVDSYLHCWTWTKERRDMLAAQGVVWNTGKFSKSETDTIRKNIEEYCKSRGVDPMLMALSKHTRKSLPEHADFWVAASQGIQRPVRLVQLRIRRMYSTENKKGKYDPEEDAELKRLTALYSKDWQKIGGLLRRSAQSVSCRHMYLTTVVEHNRTGRWTLDENNRLLKAMEEVTGLKPGDKPKGDIPWNIVAMRVSTKVAKQCELRWSVASNFIHSARQGTSWGKKDNYILIDRSGRWLGEHFRHLRSLTPPELRYPLKTLLYYLRDTGIGLMQEGQKGVKAYKPDNPIPSSDDDDEREVASLTT